MPHTRKELLSWAKDAWENITGKHQEEEVTIKGWVARDEHPDNRLFFYWKKPEKLNNSWRKYGSRYLLLSNENFPSVQWSDEEPTPATITIKIEK